MNEFKTAPSLTTEMHHAEDCAANLAHIQRLADAMAPDPKEWTYDGEVNDAGAPVARCACGHPIRYQFVIRRARDGKSLDIGSTCIESSVPYLMGCGAEGLTLALQDALARFRDAQAEAERRERDAANSDRVAVLLAERSRLVEWIRDAINATQANQYHGRRWMPTIAANWQRKKPAALSTPGRTAASLAKSMGGAFASLMASGDWMDAPAPENQEVREACAKELRRRAEEMNKYANWEEKPEERKAKAARLESMADAMVRVQA